MDIAEAVGRAQQAIGTKRYGEADGICRDILAVDPGNLAARGLRGAIAAVAGQVPQAIALLESVVSADPGNAAWCSTLCDLYRMLYRLDDSLAIGLKGLQLAPPTSAALISLAKTYTDLGRFDEALAHFLACLSLKPDDANAHLGVAQILLARGEFRPGWIEYEWRNRLDQAVGSVPHMNAPVWNGMTHPDGRILLIGDQGYGDTLQFARYIPLVAARCKEVLLAGAQDLLGLLQHVDGVGRVFHEWKAVPSFTSYARLSSLPYILGTDLSNIPGKTPYFFADEARVGAWQARLQTLPQGARRVGIFWSGRPAHPNNSRRSVKLAQFRPLASIPGVTLVSLQKEVPPDEAAELAGFPNLTDMSAHLTDFEETAALISNLDLVITVDSAVGHLAGALGKPVWLLTPTPADWRWLLDRDDTPWYPSMRLFRQPAPGAWNLVFEAIATALRRSVLV